MAGDNKLTFNPPTSLPELTQNWIRSSHGHSTPSLKISCKSVQPISRNVANKEINKQRKKERNRSKTIPRPPTGGGVIKLKCINVNILQHCDAIFFTCKQRGLCRKPKAGLVSVFWKRKYNKKSCSAHNHRYQFNSQFPGGIIILIYK